MKVPQGQEIYVGGKRYVAGQDLPDNIKFETDTVKKTKVVADESPKLNRE